MHLLEKWQFWRVPGVRDLSYVDGQMPRMWKRWNGRGGDPTQSGALLVDADSTSYNAPRSEGIQDQSIYYQLRPNLKDTKDHMVFECTGNWCGRAPGERYDSTKDDSANRQLLTSELRINWLYCLL